MLRFVHTGVAMAGAHPRLSDVADLVTADPDHDGLQLSFDSPGLI